MSLSERIIEFVRENPHSTAAQIAAGIDDIQNGDHAARLLYGLAKRGALVRVQPDGEPYHYSAPEASTPSAAQAQAQPAVAENTGSEARRVALHDTPAGALHPTYPKPPAPPGPPKPGKRAAPQHLRIALSNDNTVTLQRGDMRLVLDEEEAVELANYLDLIEELW